MKNCGVVLCVCNTLCGRFWTDHAAKDAVELCVKGHIRFNLFVSLLWHICVIIFSTTYSMDLGLYV